MIIIGAGLAGLLAGNMLSVRRPLVVDAQPSLPNNHSAVLRFRSTVVGDVTSIPFKKVTMVKCVLPWLNPVADALAYSFKNTGYYKSDRSITAGTVVSERYIAPTNLIDRLAKRCELEFARPVNKHQLKTWSADELPIISTMPMPVLMDLLDYPRQEDVVFNFAPGCNIRAVVRNCDAYVSLVCPDPELPFSRISITGNELIVECPGYESMELTFARTQAHRAAMALGLKVDVLDNITCKPQKYSKILPIPEEVRRDFIYWASHNHNIFSLGRFATWRPGLLLDDLVKDIRLIDSWTQDRYALARNR
jgi:hypothetical protein